MVATMRAHSNTMKSVGSVIITGLTGNHTLATGARIRWTARASSNGKMEKCTPVSLSMINERVMAPSFGLMVVNTSVNGRQESSMVSVPTLVKMEWRSRESGKMAERSNGSEAMRKMVKSKKIRSMHTEKLATVTMYKSIWKARNPT